MKIRLLIAIAGIGVLSSGCFLFQPSEGQNSASTGNGNESVDRSESADGNGGAKQNDDAMMPPAETLAADSEQDAMGDDGGDAAVAEGAAELQPEPPSPDVIFSGQVLAGTTSQVIDFNKADYDSALAARKNIVLYFYADWCPICRAEIPKMYEAFNRLSDSSVVGFRVNFNDTDTDDDEENLAREHGVPYQHTKVFLKNGERILKSPETWDTDRYLEEIANAFER